MVCNQDEAAGLTDMRCIFMNIVKNRQAKRKQMIKKGLKIICYVSKPALEIATIVLNWPVPAAAIFAIPEHFIKEWADSSSLEEEYAVAIDSALSETAKYYSTNRNKAAIIEELSFQVGELDSNISQVIQHTETFRSKYYTQTDANEIVCVFNGYFLVEIVKSKILSNYYLLINGADILERLKTAQVVLELNQQKLDSVHAAVEHIDFRLNDTIKSVIKYFISVIIIFCSFLFANILLRDRMDYIAIVYTFIAIFISEFIVRILREPCFVSWLDWGKNHKWLHRFKTQLGEAFALFFLIISILLLLVIGTYNLPLVQFKYAALGVLVGIALRSFYVYTWESDFN